MRILVLALALAAAPAAAATEESGLRGVVTRGSTSPVCRVEEPCEAPAAGLTLVFRQSGRVVARTTTGPQGWYRIRLKAGTYAVTTPARTVGARLLPGKVVVRAGRFVRIDLYLDTGVQ